MNKQYGQSPIAEGTDASHDQSSEDSPQLGERHWMMRFARWKDIAELVGLAAIVGSLVFVGLQMKQNQAIALAEQYQARAQATMELQLAHLEAGYVIPPLRAGLKDGVDAAGINTSLWLWIHMDNHYYQYQHGFMAEDSWQAQLRNLRGIYATCSMRFVYEWRKAGLRDSFVSLVDSLDDPCEPTQ
jgi:hypothetical protein